MFSFCFVVNLNRIWIVRFVLTALLCSVKICAALSISKGWCILRACGQRKLLLACRGVYIMYCWVMCEAVFDLQFVLSLLFGSLQVSNPPPIYLLDSLICFGRLPSWNWSSFLPRFCQILTLHIDASSIYMSAVHRFLLSVFLLQRKGRRLCRVVLNRAVTHKASALYTSQCLIVKKIIPFEHSVTWALSLLTQSASLQLIFGKLDSSACEIVCEIQEEVYSISCRIYE